MTKTAKTTTRRAANKAPKLPRICAPDGKLIAMIEADFQAACK